MNNNLGPQQQEQQQAARQPEGDAQAQNSPAEQNAGAQQQQQGQQQKNGEGFFSTNFGVGQQTQQVAGQEDWRVRIPRVILRLALAAALAAMLAFRPRKDSTYIQRNLYVAQTQILLAVVASSLMMVVGDNAARAFGIFAAASLVRFRTNIRDPKETTVLLISLALGLATGVGRWELAIILSLFVLPLLWFLEYNEEEQVFRSMELTVKTRDTAHTQETLHELFRRHGVNAEVRQIDPPDADEPIGCVMYHVQMSLTLSTDELSEEIMASEGGHVEGIEGAQKKNTAYAYQRRAPARPCHHAAELVKTPAKRRGGRSLLCSGRKTCFSFYLKG
jgi:uncharacterized membrane protein YhiD involved in acid resistance